MDLIELHIVQSFPVTCLNRDDVGAPKSAVFGGVHRARVSSQSWKRAIRSMAKEMQPESFAARRGHYIAEALQSSLSSQGIAEADAIETAEKIATFLGKKDPTKKKSHKTRTAVFLSPMEIDAIAQAAAEALNAGQDASPKKGQLKKSISACEPKDLADIAIFGRMVASDHTMMIEGAGLFSHPLSTHRANNDVDFFSAVDETKEITDEGAGHIGILEFTSSCFYRYVGLNLDLLRDRDHLKHFTDTEFMEVLEAFLRASLLAVPQARKNSMFGFTAPSFVLGLRRRGQPLSLVNAFEKAVRASNEGFVQPSITALEEHYSSLFRTFNLETDVEVRLPAVDIDQMIGSLIQDPATTEEE